MVAFEPMEGGAMDTEKANTQTTDEPQAEKKLAA